jgi:flagellar assembly protein FliH
MPYSPSVQEFVYQSIPAFSEAPEAPFDGSIFGDDHGTPGPRVSMPNVSEPELQKREAAAFERGVIAGRDAARAEMEHAIAEAKALIAANLKDFERERAAYYRKIESDIVELALAVARKVLHREAQVDRVVLAGVVRVALEKISGSSQVELRVHPTAARAWQDYLAQQTVFATVPAVVEDGSLRPDQLVLKTNHGSTELGIEAQLKEIERGFSDLVQQKQRSLKP